MYKFFVIVLFAVGIAFAFCVAASQPGRVAAPEASAQATGQLCSAPDFYQLLPLNYPVQPDPRLLHAMGNLRDSVHRPAGGPCYCLAANGTWVQGLCVR